MTKATPLYVRLDVPPDLKGPSVEQWARKALHPTAHLVTDALAAASAVVAEYTAITVSPHQSSELGVFQWVNTVIGNLKTAIRGTYHHVDVHKYLGRYLAEAQYRLKLWSRPPPEDIVTVSIDSASLLA